MKVNKVTEVKKRNLETILRQNEKLWRRRKSILMMIWKTIGDDEKWGDLPVGGTESTCKEQAAAKESAWNRKWIFRTRINFKSIDQNFKASAKSIGLTNKGDPSVGSSRRKDFALYGHFCVFFHICIFWFDFFWVKNGNLHQFDILWGKKCMGWYAVTL